MFDATFITNPYPIYQHLLASGRLHWMDTRGGGTWFAVHYDDVMALSRDPHLSTARAGTLTEPFQAEDPGGLRELEAITERWLVFLDGQDHLRLRRLLNKAFTPRVIESLRPQIQRLTDELLDVVQQRGEIEFMSQFAHPLPALVIAQLLGIPREDRSQFIEWSDDLTAFFSGLRTTLEVAQRAQAALAAMRDYFRAIVVERRQNPGSDLISLMLAAEEQGDALTEEQTLAQCTLLLFAGHETTRNLLGNGMLALLRHPDQYKLLCEKPELIRSAVEEMVRYESPVQLNSRVATAETEIHGKVLKAGQTIQLMLGAANRDPAVFPDPDRFDITRVSERPASFGFGPHICLGMPLAYVEAEIAILTILRRLPNLRLATDTPDWFNNFVFRGLRSLALTFDVAETPAGKTLLATA